jgi:hypothetical protein
LTDATESAAEWFSVRCVLRSSVDGHRVYEERVTLWQAHDFDQAVALAEAEAGDYAEAIDAEYIGLAQAYRLPDAPGHGAEVFSLCRDSELPPDEYVDRFFDTGAERQRNVEC